MDGAKEARDALVKEGRALWAELRGFGEEEIGKISQQYQKIWNIGQAARAVLARTFNAFYLKTPDLLPSYATIKRTGGDNKKEYVIVNLKDQPGYPVINFSYFINGNYMNPATASGKYAQSIPCEDWWMLPAMAYNQKELEQFMELLHLQRN